MVSDNPDERITDLDILYNFEASTKAAVTAYAGAAAMAYDPALRSKYADLMNLALNVHDRARATIAKLGGTV